MDLSSNVWIAVFTGMLTIVAAIQVGVYWRMHRANTLKERAWLTLEGLVLEHFRDEDKNGPQQPRAVIGIRNAGGTPAFITRAKVILLTQPPLPEEPDYDSVEWADVMHGSPPSILVANEYTNWRYLFPNLVLPQDYMRIEALGLDGQLWIYGLIEYTDAFKKIISTALPASTITWLRDTHAAGKRFAHVHSPKYSYAD